MSLSAKQEQLAILRHGINLVYLWCASQKLEEAPPSIAEPLKSISWNLCGVDIFAPHFRLPNTCLKSFFSDICIPPGITREPRFTNPNPLREDKIFFYNSPSEETWRAQAAGEICQDYGKVKSNEAALLVLLEKYANFLPIAEKEDYDTVSLYEHLKFLCCLASAGNGEKPFLLVSADFSGIQDFIYTISSKGALKSLRARSFFLEVLAHHIIYEIVQAAGASPANLIYCGGGGFSLLLENSPGNQEVLQTVKSTTNKWLLKELQGKVYLGIQWLELKVEEMLAPCFRASWDRIGKLLEADKAQKFTEFMTAPLECSAPKLSSEEECQICHRDDLNKEEMKTISDPDDTDAAISICPLCENLFHWGDDLTRYRCVLRQAQPPPDAHAIALPCLPSGWVHYRLSARTEATDEFLVKWVKNNWDLSEYTDGKSLSLFHADYVVKEPKSNATADFESLSESSCGKTMLGALRMDVDNLGILFTQGFTQEKFDLPRYSTFSRQLSLFFTVYMNLLCQGKNEQPLDIMDKKPGQNQQGRNVSIVYSGGDDLFIVGAWDEVTELACDIAGSFNLYFGNNPDISISGGVIVTNPHFPLYQIAHLSQRAEKAAKSALIPCTGTACSSSYGSCVLYRRKHKCARKNAVSLFYVPARAMRAERYKSQQKEREVILALQWEDVRAKVVPVVELFRLLSKGDSCRHLEVAGLSRNFTRRLFALVDLWEREGKLYYPLMHYTAAKLKISLSDAVANPQSQQAIKEFLDSPSNAWSLLNEDLIKTLWFALTWVDFLMREEQERGG